MPNILAFDLGASSGRAILGSLKDGKIVTEELHRFPNDPVQTGDRLHWDILRLYHEIKQGLLKAKHQGVQPVSIGIDSWAVDYGLIGSDGSLLGNPLHYRDRSSNGMMEKLQEELTSAEIFKRTGIQFLPFNTIYQLYAAKINQSPQLDSAKHFLMIPDLLRYFLTGEMYNEFSNASTTQLYNPLGQNWDEDLLQHLGLPKALFGQVLQPGSPAGFLQPSVQEELGLGPIAVHAVAEHDTASAVVAVPATDRSFAYLSCGTWSLLGTEVSEPVMTEEALRLNFTNEGGFGGTYRLLKNIMGLWILQECRREWERVGRNYSFPELVKLAGEAPAFQSFIEPDDPAFMAPGDMPSRVKEYCGKTNQPVPEEVGAIVRCILESLAFKYRYVLELTERLSGQQFKGLHMVGGGIHNTLLCQWTANAIGKPVWAGPAEGSAIGNLAVQWIANGEFADIWEARQAIRESFPVTVYDPNQTNVWNDGYGRYLALTNLR
ncbi:rhamnulokinase [Paenibacillus glycanilyticus]|uniref:L-fuculose kinase n=1 Tax=Paenibacillus glycanilyticus TaxID=126569 RepID=A0ABQ6GK61_9BACL|nr:rhamnulokinase family protein [Paenibacillus glycanilyticus]GLX71233.1 L-fuculose kinase [Paenibacillus glycanilyticus]